MMKAYIYLEFTRTTSFVTVRQLEQEKGVQDSNQRQWRLAETSRRQKKERQSPLKRETTSGWSEDLQ